MDDDTVIELTPEEWHAGAQRALNDLGLTYAELEGQARRRDFTSAQAHSLWTSIGGTIRPELLPDTKGRPSTAAGPQPRTEMVEERNAAEMAAHVTAWRPPCPLHDGPSIEGTHCTCDGITDAYGNPIENDA